MPRRLRIILILLMAGRLPLARAESSSVATTKPDLSAIEELIHELADPDPAVARRAQQRLLAAGVEARPALLRGTKSPSPAIADRSRRFFSNCPGAGRKIRRKFGGFWTTMATSRRRADGGRSPDFGAGRPRRF